MSKIAVIGLVGESVFLSLERHQAVGETAHASSIHREWGGKGYNQAVAAARFGAEVSFLGAVGREDVARVLLDARENGITPFLIGKDVPSAYGVITTDSEGANRVTVFGGAALSVSDVESFREEIESCDALLISNEVPECVNIRAVEIAKAAGRLVIYNPAPARETSSYLYETCDLLTPNEFEARSLPDGLPLVITLGAEGCYVKSRDMIIPPFKPERVVDTTGAGDTFNGVLTVMLAGGEDIADACRVANAAAALEVSKRFVIPSIPTGAEIRNFMGKQ